MGFNAGNGWRDVEGVDDLGVPFVAHAFARGVGAGSGFADVGSRTDGKYVLRASIARMIAPLRI